MRRGQRVWSSLSALLKEQDGLSPEQGSKWSRACLRVSNPPRSSSRNSSRSVSPEGFIVQTTRCLLHCHSAHSPPTPFQASPDSPRSKSEPSHHKSSKWCMCSNHRGLGPAATSVQRTLAPEISTLTGSPRTSLGDMVMCQREIVVSRHI
ncbi:hypothetical protein LZ30DRAFT_361127 [Colletotrichum cereale]|nr:hypothetical protein LZ30DRAFT_361127 [Colletotrichum cereale]